MTSWKFRDTVGKSEQESLTGVLLSTDTGSDVSYGVFRAYFILNTGLTFLPKRVLIAAVGTF